MIFLGLALLLSGETIRQAGGSAPWMAITVTVVLGLTVLSVIELLGGSGEYGGSYILVHEAMGGLPAFAAGWSMLAAGLALTAALVKLAAELGSRLLESFGLPETLTPPAALGILTALILLQLFQLLPRRIKLRTVVVVIAAGLGAVMLWGMPVSLTASLAAERPVGARILVSTTAWLSASFLAIETMLSKRRQVVDPGRIQPVSLAVALAVGGLAMAGVFWLLYQMGPPAAGGLQAVIEAMDLRFAPAFGAISFAVLILAVNSSLMTTARQLDSLARAGALPQWIRRVRKPFALPLPVFGLLLALSAPLILAAPTDLLVWTASAALLIVMMLLNLTAIRSHSSEPERRRPFRVPFSPLVPSLALVTSVVLLRFIATPGLLSTTAWLALGAVYYFAYARIHQVEAQEGETIFKPAGAHPVPPERFRILVPIGPGEERKFLLRMATALARQMDGEVIPLQIIQVPDPLAIEEGKRTARERNTLFRWSVRAAADAGIPVYPVTRLARSISEGIRDTALEESCNLILMPWVIKPERDGPRRSSILSKVARDAPCDVAVLSYHRNAQANGPEKHAEEEPSGSMAGPLHTDEKTITNILVPTAGGPNAPLAIELALLWARAYNAKVTTAYVTNPNASNKDLEEGQSRIEQTIEAMHAISGQLLESNGKAATGLSIEGKVIRAEDVISGIAETGDEYGLILLGATEQNLVDQVLFGNIPEQVAQRSRVPVIIVKRYAGLPRLWLSHLWNAVLESFPQLTAEEQIELYRTIHRGARPDVDFFVMIGLSAVIATYGLFQNSGAVIIGAMLVAPLFSPLIALSLAIVQGNIRLLRLALESNLKGITLAAGLTILLTLLASLRVLTPEITSRSEPALADLIVALASGAAGAYAMARKDVATALPGVAIAAALVPPLAVVGIGIATGDVGLATGSFLLLAANLVAIVLAGALVFLLLGFRPGRQGEREVHLRRGLVITLALFVLITIPLAAVFLRSLDLNRTERTIQNHIQNAFQVQPALEVIDPEQIELREVDDVLEVTIPVYTTSVLDLSLPLELGDQLTEAVGRPVRVRLAVQTLLQSHP